MKLSEHKAREHVCRHGRLDFLQHMDLYNQRVADHEAGFRAAVEEMCKLIGDEIGNTAEGDEWALLAYLMKRAQALPDQPVDEKEGE